MTYEDQSFVAKCYVDSSHFHNRRSGTFYRGIFLGLHDLWPQLLYNLGSCCDQGQELGKRRSKFTDISRINLEEIEGLGFLGKPSCPIKCKFM